MKTTNSGFRSAVLAAAVVVVAIVVVVGLLNRDSGLDIPPIHRDSPQSQEVQHLIARTPEASRSAEVVLGAEAATQELEGEECFCPEDTVACFWSYVAPILQVTDSAERRRLVHRKASALRRMSSTELETLGLRSTNGISFSFSDAEPHVDAVVSTLHGFGGEVDLTDALMERWVECANRNDTSRELRAAAVELWFQAVPGSLVDVDAAILELSCTVLGYFDEPEDIEAVAMPLLRALQALPAEAKMRVDDLAPMVFVLASLARQEGEDAAMVQREVLALIEAPWLDGERANWLMQLTAGSSFERWAQPLSTLLRTGSPGAKWGAVEGLRFFAARKRNPVDSSLLFEMMPPTLFFEDYAALRWAAIELIAAYGGVRGEMGLGALLQDSSYPHRGDVISFLAQKNKLDPGLCRNLARDADPTIRDAAIHALGTLVRNGDPSAYGELRTLALSQLNPDAQKAAIVALCTTGQPEVLADLQQVAEQGDPSVQFLAIAEIGRLPRNAANELLDFASDTTKDERARSLAFDEALLDLPDEQVPAVVERMYRDSVGDIAIKGYVAMAALAMGSDDQNRIAAWRSLSPPSLLLAKAGELTEEQAKSWLGEAAARAFSGTIEERVTALVQQEIARLSDPALQREIAEQDDLVELAPEGSAARAWLGKRFAYEKRMATLITGKRD